MVWWIASRADDEQYMEEQPREDLFLADEEQYKGKNSLLRLRCSCAWWLSGWELDELLDAPTVVASSTYIGPGPLPKC